MRIMRDAENDGFLWVDRETDGRADHFEPCGVCGTALVVQNLEGRAWHEEELCEGCENRLEIQSAISDAANVERPHILDRLAERLWLERTD
jgi:hypothetical protein